MNNNIIPYSNFERFEPDAAKEIYKRLPRQMLCTNSLSLGLRTEAKTTGVRRRYIQINHANLTKIMVFDIDNPVYLYDFNLLDVPVPNLIIENPKNHHAHFVYLLDKDNYVCKSTKARLKDILIYNNIYSSLCKMLNADSRYVQKIMKNPFHNSWNTKVLHDDTYSLEDFAKYAQIDLKTDILGGNLSRNAQSFLREEEGRNCTIFERTRFYAYSILKNYNNGATLNDVQNFYNALEHYANTINNEFSQPLPQREIKATIKSIANWTLIHMGNAVQEAEFKHKDIWGDESRKKSLKTRQEKKSENIKKAGKLKAEGKTLEEICKELNRSKRMVEYYINEYKKLTEENKEIQERIIKIKENLIQWIDMQFVISDIFGLTESIELFRLLLMLEGVG